MKTTIFITALFFGFQSNLLFANTGDAQSLYSGVFPHFNKGIYVLYSAGETTIPAVKILTPAIPFVADFSDNDLETSNYSANPALTPLIPREADFIDSDADMLNILVPLLTPATPKEADFMDADIEINEEANFLAPVIPNEATFEDHS